MSDLNELFAELKAEIADLRLAGFHTILEQAEDSLYRLDELINNGEFARAERDAYIG
jgi:hypothetical protein